MSWNVSDEEWQKTLDSFIAAYEKRYKEPRIFERYMSPASKKFLDEMLESYIKNNNLNKKKWIKKI